MNRSRRLSHWETNLETRPRFGGVLYISLLMLIIGKSKQLGVSMHKVTVFLILTTIAALAVACAPPAAFTQVSEDTYLIKRSDKAGIFGNAIEMREDVIREANEFAASKGKIAEKVVISETPVGFGRYATVEYTFRLADEQPTAQDADNSALAKNKDLYTELMKLNDLRERGLLTDREFQAQKQKLLDDN